MCMPLVARIANLRRSRSVLLLYYWRHLRGRRSFASGARTPVAASITPATVAAMRHYRGGRVGGEYRVGEGGVRPHTAAALVDVADITTPKEVRFTDRGWRGRRLVLEGARVLALV